VSGDFCGVCGGDGRIDQSAGQTSRCPACLGSGRRSPESTGFHDVTKTKPSHHRGSNQVAKPVKQTWPTSISGDLLAKDIRDCATLSTETKTRLIQEIMEHESRHGQCTQTFVKKMRKQIRLSRF